MFANKKGKAVDEVVQQPSIERALQRVWHRGIVPIVSHLSGFIALVALLIALAVAIPIGFVRFYFSVRRDDEIWHSMFQRMFGWYLAAAGVTLKIEGGEYLPPDYLPVIVAANHQTMLDGPIMDLATGARRGVAMTAPADYFPWPMSFWVRKVGSIEVARSEAELKKYGPRGALTGKQAIKQAVAALHKRHVSLLIFPEGHTERSHEPLPFQTGAVRIALVAGVPIIPATIHNTNGVMNIKRLMLQPGTIRISFHPQFALPSEASAINDYALVSLLTSQLLCHIAQDLPASYFTPGMVLACKEVLSLHPVLSEAMQSTKRHRRRVQTRHRAK